jgi:hypothetical protein
VLPDLDQREGTEDTVIIGRPVQGHLLDQHDVVYKIQLHPRVKMMVVVVHFNRLVPYLGTTQDKQP